MIKKISTSFFASLLLVAVAAMPTNGRYLVTADQFGTITKTTNYQELITLFGKDKLTDETHTGAEGMGSYKVTIVYKRTPLEMTITWAENEWHKTIAIVECAQRKSPYYTKDSLQVGSTLLSILKINKAAVNFYGFGWDYGGTIISYNKGALAKSKVHFTLAWDGKNDTTLSGDGELNSKMLKVSKRAAQVYIASMQVVFVN